MSRQALPSMPSLPKNRTVPDKLTNDGWQIKMNKSTTRTKSAQFRRQYWNVAVHKSIHLFSTCYLTLLGFISAGFHVFIIWSPIRTTVSDKWSVFCGQAGSKCVWSCASLPGAQVSQMDWSCWVNEAVIEMVNIQLWRNKHHPPW